MKHLNRTLKGTLAGVTIGTGLAYTLVTYSHDQIDDIKLLSALPIETTWMVVALILGGFGVLAAIILASAIADHARSVRDVAEQIVTDQASQLVVTEENWRTTIEQILADITREPVYINSFSAMASGQTAWIRFMSRDSRAWVFASQSRTPECKGRGRRVRFDMSRRASGELRAIWNYFMAQSQQARPLSRNTEWYLMPAQIPQDKVHKPTCMHIARNLSGKATAVRNKSIFSSIRRVSHP